MTVSKLVKMAERSQNRLKTLWEMEKLLFMSNFSFSHSVLERLLLQTRKNQGLFGKGLNETQNIKFVSHRVENIVGKREMLVENAGYQHFLLFPQSFQKAHFTSQGH